MGILNRIQQNMYTPISGLSLGVFRAMFGLLVLWDVILELVYGEADILEKYIRPDFHFKNYLFEWVVTWPELWMAYLHYIVLGVAAFCVMVGLFYRVAIILVTAMVAWIFFAEMAYYLNHYYLVIVTGFLMCFLPMNRAFSIDALRHPEWKDETVPQWSLWALKAKVEIVLLYAGIVKINYDWLHLEPLRTWMRNLSDWHMFAPMTQSDVFIAIAAYGAIILHLVGAPLLFFKKTRLWVFLIYCAFHLLNSYMFDIGIFPFMTIAATLIFFDPEWPRQFVAWLKQGRDQIRTYYAGRPRKPERQSKQKVVIACVLVFLIFQALFPLRHLLYPGNVAWTQEGHQFSWRMKLRSTKTSFMAYRVYDPDTKQEWIVNPRDYLTDRQYDKIGGNPEYILQFAHHLQKRWAQIGHPNVEVYARVKNSLNGRPPVPYIDDTVDLTKEEWGLAPETWILPLNEPLKPPKESH